MHTFGRDLKWIPHIHALICERYIDNKGRIHKLEYFHFSALRKTFLYQLLSNIIKELKRNKADKEDIAKIYYISKNASSLYKNGAYVYAPSIKKDSNGKYNSNKVRIKNIAKYIARYAGHPALSLKRVLNVDYKANTVTWYYDPHEDDTEEDESKKKGRQIITDDVYEFIKRLIIHIPDKGFNLIRYYGFYSNKYKDKDLFNNTLFTDYELKKLENTTYWIGGLKSNYGYNPLICNCGFLMRYNYLYTGVP
jgi:hypothetical protein